MMPDLSSPAATRGQSSPPEDDQYTDGYACEPFCMCDLELTVEELDSNQCDACGKPVK